VDDGNFDYFTIDSRLLFNEFVIYFFIEEF